MTQPSGVELPKLEERGWQEIGEFVCTQCGHAVNLPINDSFFKCQVCGSEESECNLSWAVPVETVN